MRSTEARVDWNQVKECLTVLHRESPAFLDRSVLIGGAACWFYRIQLQRSADPDFAEPNQTESSRKSWLSKDIDFTGIFRADAWRMAPSLVVRDQAGHQFLEVAGVRLGFAQVGVTFAPDEAFKKARIAQFDSGGQTVQFLVLDPITLYREKQALCQKRNEPHDHLHFQVVREYLALELVRTCENLLRFHITGNVAEQQADVAFLLDLRRGALEITFEPRVRRRIDPFLVANDDRSRFVRELIFSDE